MIGVSPSRCPQQPVDTRHRDRNTVPVDLDAGRRLCDVAPKQSRQYTVRCVHLGSLQRKVDAMMAMDTTNSAARATIAGIQSPDAASPTAA